MILRPSTRRAGLHPFDVLPVVNDRDSSATQRAAPVGSCFNESSSPPDGKTYRLSAGVSPLRPSGGEDVACSIEVAVVDGAAQARPLSDRQRLLPVDPPAHRAGLRRREEPVHLREMPTVPGRFLLHHPGEHAPAGIVHQLRQPRPRQTGHAQVLDEHRLVLADDRRGYLVRDSRASRRGGCGSSTESVPHETTCGPRRTSPRRAAGHPSRSSGSTSNSNADPIEESAIPAVNDRACAGRSRSRRERREPNRWTIDADHRSSKAQAVSAHSAHRRGRVTARP